MHSYGFYLNIEISLVNIVSTFGQKSKEVKTQVEKINFVGLKRLKISQDFSIAMQFL